MTVRHWNEFGPEAEFNVYMDQMDRLLGISASTTPKDFSPGDKNG